MRIRGRKPTYEERKIISANKNPDTNKKYDPMEWLVTKNTSTFIEIVNRNDGSTKTIGK